MAERERRSVYGKLEGMSGLESLTPGFDCRDQYWTTCRLFGEFALSRLSAEQRLKEIMRVNLLSYGLERDMEESSREYVMVKEGGRWRVKTDEHRDFPCLTYMALDGAKKAREVGDDWGRELAELLGVRELRSRLIGLEEGQKLVLFYPPLPDGDTSVIYVFTQDSGDEDEEKRILVENKMVGLSLAGVNALWELYMGEGEVDREDAFFRKTPELLSVETEKLFRVAEVMATDPWWGTGRELKAELTFDNAKDYYDQVGDASRFLAEVFMEEYDQLGGGALDELSLRRLELAFNFARRAVLQMMKGKDVIDTVTMMRLYKQKLALDMSSYVQREMVVAYQVEMRSYYGDLARILERARGCPGAELGSLEHVGGIVGDQVEVRKQSLSGECKERQCVACGHKPIADEATECPVCAWAPGRSVEYHRRKLQKSRAEEENGGSGCSSDHSEKRGGGSGVQKDMRIRWFGLASEVKRGDREDKELVVSS